MAIDQELVDAKIATADARTDSKFGQLMAEIRALSDRMDARFAQVDARFVQIESEQESIKNSIRSTRTSIWGATSIIIGTMIGILSLLSTLMPWSYNLGTQIKDRIGLEVAAQMAKR